ncbi:DUF4352 domain-containing protein [Streptococcus gallolyticus]|uniref:DUF4352 domain-containing protein n=1 Tax=Streptococcus gallolyticus TaxID=315405 RepID=UPI00228413A0|nr:DUF4352 domain-containing protein [Streptococcus gallolyticus]MCY7185547.1 DUF4352 domain-containing protein [Streptococcus gallolyticus subsp. gallolyticus]MCY7189432.1 DUF4352 domain-containing protein [Streptococcus gallolyticus subsp. gallolyticus]
MDSKNTNQNEKGTNKFSEVVGKAKSQWSGLSKTKKIIAGVAGVIVIGGVGFAIYQASTGTSVASAISGSPLKITVNSADVIIPEDSEKGTTYVAYNVTFENKGSDKIQINSSDVQLVDEDGETLSSEYVYASTNDFKVMDLAGASLGKGKKRTGYLVYKVDPKKSKDYSIEAECVVTGDDSYDRKEAEQSLAKVTVTDNRDEIEQLASDYINQVFLASQSTSIGQSTSVGVKASDTAQVTNLASKSDKKKDNYFQLGNSIEADKELFVKRFKEELGSEFDYFTPSDSEMETFVNQYMEANAKRAQVSVSVEELYPTSAKIKVESKSIDIAKIDMNDLVDGYLEQATGKDFSSDEAVMQDAEKYVFASVPSHFDSTELATETDENSISLSLKDKKWSVDSSDKITNYGYSGLQKSMSGHFFY